MTRRHRVPSNMAKVMVAAAVAVIMFSAFRYSTETANAVRNSFVSCAVNVLPTLFPFMVVSSIIVKLRLVRPAERILTKPFVKLFGLPPASVTPYLLGLTCSFPVGVSSTAEAYGNGLLTLDEAERTAALSNNTGPGFIVAVAGITLGHNVKTGMLIYISEIVSSLIAGSFMFHGCKPAKEFNEINTKMQNRNIGKVISESISGAVFAVGAVTANVVFFSTLSKTISLSFGIINPTFQLFSDVLLEFTEGVKSSLNLGGSVGVALAAFSVCSGGVSVLCQSASVASAAGFSVKKSALFKLFQGTIAALICLIISYLFPAFLPFRETQISQVFLRSGNGMTIIYVNASFCVVYASSKILRLKIKHT